MPLPKAPAKPADIVDLEEHRASSRKPAAQKKPQGVQASAPSKPAAQSPALLRAVEQPALFEELSLPAVEPSRSRGLRTPRAEREDRQPVSNVATLGGAKRATQHADSGRATRRGTGPAKLFVLDTNVLLHDPTSVFRFEEHDIYLPMMTLEELDNNKKGMSEVARNARSVSRMLDQLVEGFAEPMEKGIPLSKLGNKDATGKLFFQTQATANALPATLPVGKADNQILGVVRALSEMHSGREVVLVSKDINMRVKARALNLSAEDYFNDKVLEDRDMLYSGVFALPADFWDKHSKGMESWQHGGATFYRVTGPSVASMLVNQFVFHETTDGIGQSLYAQVTEISGKTAVLRTVKDYTHAKHAVWGVTARNREQNFALNLLMNPEVDFVTLLGQAGTGKTLITLAAALAQCLDKRLYSEIIMTRATVPVGEDIGFLPGTEEEKMAPWMGAVEDNLEVLLGSPSGSGHGGEWGKQATSDLIKSKIKIKSMNFMRGRTFQQKFLIIDEAQNLTPKQMKTLITRAGPGTKVVCMGNIAQIDTPYLTEGSSGLTFVVDRFKGWPHSGHVTLARGERSRLADFAADAL
ncbi:PhoH family protein [Piscinibacterium candidicorallinum]|uniref:PhoH family protein n=1 Tax=Piscinibacterium candidicorallinum TaxID=1793872 RepID=A0ABV7H6B6_9BURK